MTAVLELSAVTKRYGALRAVNDVSLTVERGARHALIGPNGAGKSTLFHLITGTVRSSAGRVVFDGRNITRLREHRRTQLGIGRTFQQSSLFGGLSVLDNVLVAVQQRLGFGRRLYVRPAAFRAATDRAHELLELVGLELRANTPARVLGYGQQRQLEVALALATEPTLMLMDEPTAGMSREEANEFLAVIAELPQSLTMLVVEHDMDVVFGLASWVSVLDAGRLIANGRPDEIRGSPAVQEAYLGSGERMEELFLTR